MCGRWEGGAAAQHRRSRGVSTLRHLYMFPTQCLEFWTPFNLIREQKGIERVRAEAVLPMSQEVICHWFLGGDASGLLRGCLKDDEFLLEVLVQL